MRQLSLAARNPNPEKVKLKISLSSKENGYNRIFYTMGLWNWVLLGFVLLFLELLLPAVSFSSGSVWLALVTASVAALTGSLPFS